VFLLPPLLGMGLLRLPELPVAHRRKRLARSFGTAPFPTCY